MERIFKIKTKTNPHPRFQYPSERRYSASIVLGLSVVFLQLLLYAILMGSLIIHKISLQKTNCNSSEMALNTFGTDSELGLQNGIEIMNITENVNKLREKAENDITLNHVEDVSTTEDINVTEYSIKRLRDKIQRDLENDKMYHSSVNIPALVCAGCFIMAFGSLLSFTTGLLAWKRWYIDNNITLFFLSTTFSSLTSALCLLLSLLTTMNMDFNLEVYEVNNRSPVTPSLAMNIIILSCIGVIWSCVSTNVAYKGMKNCYPDDMVISKSGRTVQISTVTKGGKNLNPLTPDIINHFPASGKLAKYLPKRDNGNLPKAESNVEYQERVNKFLSGDPDNSENVK